MHRSHYRRRRNFALFAIVLSFLLLFVSCFAFCNNKKEEKPEGNTGLTPPPRSTLLELSTDQVTPLLAATLSSQGIDLKSLTLGENTFAFAIKVQVKTLSELLKSKGMRGLPLALRFAGGNVTATASGTALWKEGAFVLENLAVSLGSASLSSEEFSPILASLLTQFAKATAEQGGFKLTSATLVENGLILQGDPT